MSWWWLSFRDPKKPEGSSFLGVVVVQAKSMKLAMKEAWRLECNPGGEVLGEALPPEVKIPEQYQNKLLSRTEGEELNFLIRTQFS